MLEFVADIAHVIVVDVYDRSKNCIMGKIIRIFARYSNTKGTINMQEF
jgi:broad-specificity NMP kinase